MDDKFETSRSRKAGPVDDLAGGLASGGESLAKGVVSGISGIFTKPIEGAKKGGAKGFAKGFAKGKSPHSFTSLGLLLWTMQKRVTRVRAWINFLIFYLVHLADPVFVLVCHTRACPCF